MPRMALTAVLLVLGALSLARSDEQRAPFGHVTSSASGQIYFRMVPPRGDAPGHGALYRVGQTGEDERVWSVKGWYAQRVFVPDDGRSLVRLGDWPFGLAPQDTHLGVAFYQAGKLVKKYSTKDLVKDVSKVRPSVSHYQFFDWEDPPALVSLHVNGSYHHVFRLRSIDGITYLFDPATGEIVHQSPSEQDIVKNEETALAIARAVLKERYGDAPASEPDRTLKAERLVDEWHVNSFPYSRSGFHVRIQARDGCIIRLEHRP